MASILYTAMGAVKTAIVNANLTGITTNVLLRRFPYVRDGVTLPAVLVCPLPETINDKGGTNASNDIGYGVQVTAAQASNQKLDDTNLDRLLQWRESIRTLFHNKRLSGAGNTVWIVKVEPGPVIDPQAWASMMDATTLILRVMSREAIP